VYALVAPGSLPPKAMAASALAPKEPTEFRPEFKSATSVHAEPLYSSVIAKAAFAGLLPPTANADV
jgi:hypothetical protein